MVLTRYFLKRFFKYFFLINFSLTLLFNFIEFFEKIVRVKHATLKIVIQFIALNIVPSFFQTIPISVWLATCLILKEFFQQNEWETFKIINVNYTQIFKNFMLAGVIILISTFLFQEQISFKLQNSSENFKQKKIKQNSIEKIANKWFQLTNKKNEKTFCHIDFLDFSKKQGTGLFIVKIDPDFQVKKTILAKDFEINTKDKTIIIKKGNKTIPQKFLSEVVDNHLIKIPSFFSQIKLSNKISPSLKLLKVLTNQKDCLPFSIWKEILIKLIKRILFYLQIIIYPLLTFSIFAFFDLKKIKWFLIFLSYPTIIILDLIVDFIASKNSPIFLIPSPYLLLIFAIIIIKKNLDKIF